MITRIEIDPDGRVTFFFDTDEPWDADEFIKGSPTRIVLEIIEAVVTTANGQLNQPA